MSYLQQAKDMYAMVGHGRMMEAFEKFYHENVVMVEATGEVRQGKTANRGFAKHWMSNIKAIHGSEVTAITSDEDEGITMSESWTEVTFQDGNRRKLEEVAVQHWEDGQIIHERFYYNKFG